MRRLQAREKLFLAAGALVVAVTLGWWTVNRLVLQRLALLDRQITAKQAELVQMHGLMSRYQALQSKLGTLDLRISEQQASFLATLDEMVERTQLKSHLDGTQTQREVEAEGFLVSVVELKFGRVSFAQALELLRQLSFGPAVVRIQRLSLERRFEDAQQLDLALALASYRPKP